MDLGAPLVANQLLLNDLHRFRIQQTFGIYLSGVHVDNEFTAEAQSLSANPIVAMNFRIVANGAKVLDVNRPAPFVAAFNVGTLSAGRHKIYVAPVVQRGAAQVRQCPIEKEILVTNSPVNLASVASRNMDEVSYGFNPATGQYWFDAKPPPYSYSFPNQPTNYPYVGNLQSIVRAGARLSGNSFLSGAVHDHKRLPLTPLSRLPASIFAARRSTCGVATTPASSILSTLARPRTASTARRSARPTSTRCATRATCSTSSTWSACD